MAITYKGTVKSTATPYLIGRDAPFGAAITKLYPGTEIQGEGDLVFSNGYYRMKLVSPTLCWVASEYLDYTTQVITEPEPAQEIFVRLVQGGTEYKYGLIGG